MVARTEALEAPIVDNELVTLPKHTIMGTKALEVVATENLGDKKLLTVKSINS